MTLAPKAAFDPVTATEWNELLGLVQLPATVTNVDTTSRTTTATGYTSTLTPANICGTTFVAPVSGKVEIHFNVRSSNGSAPNRADTAPVVKSGAVVGSGTGFLAALDQNAISSITSDRKGATVVVPGLTAGLTYNVSLEHRAFSAGTATFADRDVTVVPQVQ